MRTDFVKPFIHFQNFQHRRGIVVVLSDFYEQPETIVKTIEPLRYRGNEVILFHVLDPQEIKPKFRDPVLLVDMEDAAASLEVSPEYARNEYKRRIDAHIAGLESKARSAGLDYFLMDTGTAPRRGLARISRHPPEDALNGVFRPLVSGRERWPSGCPSGCTCCASTARSRCPSAR